MTSNPENATMKESILMKNPKHLKGSNKKNRFIVNIVPFTKIPLTRDQFFYYLSDKKLPAGTLVSISLARRKLKGIVLESKSDFKRLGNIRLKKISEVIVENFLTEKQLALAKFISNHYLVSLGIVIKLFVPKRVSSRIGSDLNQKVSKQAQKIILTKEQREIISKITKNHSTFSILNSQFLLFGPSSSGKTQIYLEAIKKLTRAKNSQALILLPELTSLEQEIERYGNFFGYEENLVVLHGKIAKGKFYENWQKIKSGKAKIIIGTRQAVFAPFKNLKIIIIDEEQDISYKQWDRNPRYDARQVAEKLAELRQAKLIFGSATPRIETFHRAKLGEIELLRLPKLQIADYESQVNIVNMRQEYYHHGRKKKQVFPISKALESEINFALKHKFQTILLVNRQGMSSFSACESCKTTLKCPRCDRALVYQKKGVYGCLHCSYKTSTFPVCPKCNGMVFKNIGLGTEKIEKEIETIFPSARIKRADFSSMKKTKDQKELWQNFSQGKIDILIGTQMVAKSWDIPNIHLVGIIDADNLFSFPDFTADEKAFSLITQAAGRAERIGSKTRGKVVIQTYHPENPILQMVAEKNFEKFYQQEIKERKTLAYPPFSRIIKILFQDSNLEKVKDETSRVYKELNQKKSKTIKISSPQDPLTPKIRGRYRQQIIIQIKNGRGEISAPIEKILKRLPSGWIIDIDPISII